MRQPELPHRKTPTPIVAKQIEKDMGILLFDLFGIIIISRFSQFVNMFSEIYTFFTLREVKKASLYTMEPFLCSPMIYQFS